MNGADFVRLTGMDRATLWRLENNEQKSITDDDLNAILTKICETDEDRAKLIMARMRDVQVGPGAELVQLSISGKPVAALRDEPPASHPFERALQTIRANHESPEVQDVIISIASLLDTGDFETKKTSYRKVKMRRAGNKN